MDSLGVSIEMEPPATPLSLDIEPLRLWCPPCRGAQLRQFVPRTQEQALSPVSRVQPQVLGSRVGNSESPKQSFQAHRGLILVLECS